MLTMIMPRTMKAAPERTVERVQLLELVDKRAVFDDFVVHDIVIRQGSHERTRDPG